SFLEELTFYTQVELCSQLFFLFHSISLCIFTTAPAASQTRCAPLQPCCRIAHEPRARPRCDWSATQPRSAPAGPLTFPYRATAFRAAKNLPCLSPFAAFRQNPM